MSTITIAAAVGAASGAIGSFVLLRRMALVGDALSHVALPGIAAALAYGIDPFWGVIGLLVPAAVFVWWLEGKTHLHSDTLVGLLFTASLAVGLLTIPQMEILDSLFGGFPQLRAASIIATGLVAGALIVLTFLFTGSFALSIIAAEISEPRVKRRSDLLVLLIFALIVSLGIKLVGTLLMGALSIIPASIARNLSSSLKRYVIGSTVVGGVMSAAGALIAHRFGWIPGPTIVLLGISLFVLSVALQIKSRSSPRGPLSHDFDAAAGMSNNVG